MTWAIYWVQASWRRHDMHTWTWVKLRAIRLSISSYTGMKLHPMIYAFSTMYKIPHETPVLPHHTAHCVL